MRLYDGADLECLFTVLSVAEDQVSMVSQVLSQHDLTPKTYWALGPSPDYDIQALDANNPMAALRISLSRAASTLCISWEGEIAGEGADIGTYFDFDESVVSLSYGNDSLVRSGAFTPWLRVVAFFELLRNVADSLQPLYAYVGPEYFHAFQMSLQNIQETGLAPFSPDTLSEREAEAVRAFYGFPELSPAAPGKS